MPKKMLIDATHAEETRVVVVDGNKVEEFDFESENRRQIAGNIYLAKVTRVEPSLQAAFVDYGGNRHGFLAFSEIHPDYYQIPVADRDALMEEERAYAEAQKVREDEDDKPKKQRRLRSRTRAAEVYSDDAVISTEVEIDGMETIDLSADDAVEGLDAETVTDVTVVEAEAVAVGVAEETVAEAEVEDTTSEEPVVEATEDPTMFGEADDAEGEDSKGSNASSKDDSIESVADEDDRDDIRPVRKPRVRRYKIQEVIKVRQILLIQVVKEERGNKGAALTTYLS
ncbi:S1 RNA-binding domain-containing protein, partial [Ascidiaceihabitans sp.]|nr:S1 RNA-binding domain-containing protein [Ascidiaceihabitans sp.]